MANPIEQREDREAEVLDRPPDEVVEVVRDPRPVDHSARSCASSARSCASRAVSRVKTAICSTVMIPR